MKSYVWITFVFLGWGYYEMSGGADFEPVQPDMASIDVKESEIVARADTTTLVSMSTSNTAVQPQGSDDTVTLAVAALDAVEDDPVKIVVAAVEPKLDIREVAGSRVNMRMGPGTGFDVITTLEVGTKLEVLAVDADGWANVSTVDRGIEGWMAERLLTDSET